MTNNTHTKIVLLAVLIASVTLSGCIESDTIEPTTMTTWKNGVIVDPEAKQPTISPELDPTTLISNLEYPIVAIYESIENLNFTAVLNSNKVVTLQMENNMSLKSTWSIVDINSKCINYSVIDTNIYIHIYANDSYSNQSAYIEFDNIERLGGYWATPKNVNTTTTTNECVKMVMDDHIYTQDDVSRLIGSIFSDSSMDIEKIKQYFTNLSS